MSKGCCRQGPEQGNTRARTVRLKQRAPVIIRAGAIGLIGFGLTLRVSQYLAGRSLWIDKAMPALNIVNRSFVELTQPLDHAQGAPVGFLLIQKLILRMLGSEDYVLRLFPFVAGVLSLYLVYRLADQYIRGAAALSTLALFAASGPLV